jgi:hypothetical protein
MLIELKEVLGQKLKYLYTKTTTVLSEHTVPKTVDVRDMSLKHSYCIRNKERYCIEMYVYCIDMYIYTHTHTHTHTHTQVHMSASGIVILYIGGGQSPNPQEIQ